MPSLSPRAAFEAALLVASMLLVASITVGTKVMALAALVARAAP